MTGSDLGDSCGQLTKTRLLPDYSTVPSKRITHTAMRPNFPATLLFLSSNMLQSQKFTLDVINKKKKIKEMCTWPEYLGTEDEACAELL